MERPLCFLGANGGMENGDEDSEGEGTKHNFCAASQIPPLG